VNVLLRKARVIDPELKNSPVAAHLVVCRQPLASVSMGRPTGFFSASKANLRNAP
jgi:hypothetical protein